VNLGHATTSFLGRFYHAQFTFEVGLSSLLRFDPVHFSTAIGSLFKLEWFTFKVWLTVLVCVVITHKSNWLKKVVRERLDGYPREGGDRLPNSAQAA